MEASKKNLICLKNVEGIRKWPSKRKSARKERIKGSRNNAKERKEEKRRKKRGLKPQRGKVIHYKVEVGRRNEFLYYHYMS